MRKSVISLALAAVLGLAAVPAQAFFEANLTGGYTTLAMSALNDYIKGCPSCGVTSSTPVNSGYYVALDAGIAIFPFLKIVPRVEYVSAGQGKQMDATYDSTIDLNLVPMELGLSVDAGLPFSGLSVRGAVFGGYGMATSMTTYKLNAGGPSISNLYQGGGFTAEAVGNIRYDIFPFTALVFDLGYRMANIPSMKDTAGFELKKVSSTDSLNYDFSGLNVGGGLNISF
jgi:hypothetical protein